MSYLNQAQDPRRRAASGAVVVVVHAAIGLALVFGLSVAMVEPEKPEWIPTIDFTPKPPPKPDPTDKPEVSAQKPVAPVPPIDVQRPPDVIVDIFDPADPVLPYVPENRTIEVAPDPTPSPPSFTPRRAVPRNSSSSWISTDDYPRRPLIELVEGEVGYRLVVGTNGRVASCEVTRPSGNRALDDASCRLISSRARFEAATDETGAKVLGTFAGSVRWQIPN